LQPALHQELKPFSFQVINFSSSKVTITDNKKQKFEQGSGWKGLKK
jgi:hypothetical protein